jgi:hypothetical protein
MLSEQPQKTTVLYWRTTIRRRRMQCIGTIPEVEQTAWKTNTNCYRVDRLLDHGIGKRGTRSKPVPNQEM